MVNKIDITIDSGVADVRLARAEKLNALNPEMFEDIAEVLSQLAVMPDLRAVVLSGAGRGFCVGVDLEALSDVAKKNLTARTHGPANLYQHAAWGWRNLPVPVIAAVHGYAFGAGFQIMLGADIRIATPDTQLSMMEMRWGLVPDMAGIRLLRGLVREDVARDVVFTARKFTGKEGQKMGFITRLAAEPHAEAMAMAHVIAASSPKAIRAAKRLLNLQADSKTILMAEAEEQQWLLESAEHAETLAAYRENRPPVFFEE